MSHNNFKDSFNMNDPKDRALWEKVKNDAERISEEHQAKKINNSEGKEAIIAFSLIGIVVVILGGLWIKDQIGWLRIRSQYKTFSSVCLGTPFPDNPPYNEKANINPTIGFSPNGNPNREYIPKRALARSPESLTLALCVRETQEKTRKVCSYEAGNTHIIKVEKVTVALHEIYSGKVVAQETFDGNPLPKSCRPREEFPAGCRNCEQYEVHHVLEDPIHKTRIQDWAAGYVRQSLF